MKPVPREFIHGLAMVLVFIVLAFIYSVVTPIFEASDEISHYPVVNHIAATGKLPVQQVGVKTLWEQEGSQPPLYYGIGAALTFWIDTRDLQSLETRNPHAKLGIPGDSDNKNMILHTDRERFPWSGTSLAVHLIRFFSILLGTGTVLTVYFLACEITRNQSVIILTTVFTAFNPMFLFISGSVNNDNLIILLSSMVLLALVRSIKFGLTNQRILFVSILTALASITKISGLTLYPVVGLAIIYVAFNNRTSTVALKSAVAILITWLVVAGWWYLRNLNLYGELLGINMQVAIAGSRSITLWELRQEFQGFWINYWGLFGAVNILMDDAVYWLYTVLSIAGLAGLVLKLYSRLETKNLQTLILPSLLVIYWATVFIGLVRWTLMTYASQGRLMFPAIGVISLFIATGLIDLTRRVPIQWAWWVVSLVLVSIAAIVPFRYIGPTYMSPPLVSEIPDSAIPINATYDGFRIIAAEAPVPTLRPEGYIPVTLYLSTDRALDVNYSLFIHALGRSLQEVGKIDSYPGGGNLPTSHMMPGTIIKDVYRVPLSSDFEVPTLIRLQIGAGLRRSDTDYQSLTPTFEDGRKDPNIFINGAVAYPSLASKCTDREAWDAEYQFGDFAEIRIPSQTLEVKAGETLRFSLLWNYVNHTPVDWTLFTHLVNKDGLKVAQADSPPLDTDFPTSFWRESCWFREDRSFTIPQDAPPGEYRILIGLYDPLDPLFQRLPIATKTGVSASDDAIEIGPVIVKR